MRLNRQNSIVTNFKCLMTAFLFLASCSSAKAPPDVIRQLEARWSALPGSETHNLTVVRSWRGIDPVEDVSLPEALEIWCLDTQISPKNGSQPPKESMMWIATKSDRDAAWQLYPLMAMSSTWPYESCLGEGP